MNYTDYNAKAWDAIAEGRTEDGRAQFTKIISHEDYLRAKEGILQVSLTSSKYVPESWFPPLKGKKLLGLACGGGQQTQQQGYTPSRRLPQSHPEKPILCKQEAFNKCLLFVFAFKHNLKIAIPFPESTISFPNMSPATVQKIAPYQKFRFHATRLSKNIPAQHPAPTIGRCENR